MTSAQKACSSAGMNPFLDIWQAMNHVSMSDSTPSRRFCSAGGKRAIHLRNKANETPPELSAKMRPTMFRRRL